MKGPYWWIPFDPYSNLLVTEFFYYLQTFGEFTLPSTACSLGIDHLFVGVEVDKATLQSDTEPYSECFLENNFVSLPVMCIDTGIA